jgi:hypothetical protein
MFATTRFAMSTPWTAPSVAHYESPPACMFPSSVHPASPTGSYPSSFTSDYSMAPPVLLYFPWPIFASFSYRSSPPSYLIPVCCYRVFSYLRSVTWARPQSIPFLSILQALASSSTVSGSAATNTASSSSVCISACCCFVCSALTLSIHD